MILNGLISTLSTVTNGVEILHSRNDPPSLLSWNLALSIDNLDITNWYRCSPTSQHPCFLVNSAVISLNPVNSQKLAQFVSTPFGNIGLTDRLYANDRCLLRRLCLRM